MQQQIGIKDKGQNEYQDSKEAASSMQEKNGGEETGDGSEEYASGKNKNTVRIGQAKHGQGV